MAISDRMAVTEVGHLDAVVNRPSWVVYLRMVISHLLSHIIFFYDVRPPIVSHLMTYILTLFYFPYVTTV